MRLQQATIKGISVASPNLTAQEDLTNEHALMSVWVMDRTSCQGPQTSTAATAEAEAAASAAELVTAAATSTAAVTVVTAEAAASEAAACDCSL